MSGNLEAVALAVLSRALHDACDVIHDIGRGRPTRDAVIAEARAFWESDAPEWRCAREAWCDAANVHPDKTRAVALAEIAKAAGVPVGHARTSRSDMIRRDFAAGMTVPQLVERHGMSRSGVYKALASRRSRWS